ncbi:arabinosyltransferase domain-containing protein [Actinomycetospora endophytica]|uniref:Arabinosyltransferase domain-containing protein n=1 Tax=Actinomycetospora endophytica TaxID=2291215 RepID=A0ABS8P8E8_9PSEU|nr:arabinosyltransferase domain-containing protein [Actinomycetospora endophytica]MCD2193314.1 arabinosyltransferase domain-containing protein [Actinomycetospora endophytica]
MGEGTGRGVEPSDDDSGSTTTVGLMLRRLVPTRSSAARTAPSPADDSTTEPVTHTGSNGRADDAFTPGDGPDRWGPDDWGLDGLLVARVIAVASALVAVACGVLLPFAPVIQNHPEIRWPVDVARPAPTMLMLTAYQPESFSAQFSCRAAREADGTPDGYVLTTMSPTSGEFDEKALSIRVRAGTLTVHTGGKDILAERLPPGDCSYQVAGDASRVTVSRDGRPLGSLAPRLGEVDPDEVKNVPPNSTPAAKPISPLPNIDALSTSLTALPGATPADLSVNVSPDDRYASTPSPFKSGLITATVLAVVLGGLATTAAIYLGRRRTRWREAALDADTVATRADLDSDGWTPPPWAPRWWARIDAKILSGLTRLRMRGRPRLVDAVVVVALWSWLYLAPLTDDDGYYSAMAANVPFSGYVPNYYQLYNQGFTPFSWPYYLLSWWQQQAGVSPVALRVPSVVLGVITWFAIRVFVARCPGVTHPWREHRWIAFASRAVLGVAFLAWWLPYDVGTRPEPYTAVFAALALAVVAEGVERERMDLLALAVGLGGVGLMTAPTGFICLAPLLAAAPTAWRVIRSRSAHWWEIPPRWLVVIAPGALGALAGFADGTYGDFVRSQQIFAPIQRAQTWYLEFQRYAFLLDETSRFGAYAKRTAVLLCLLALVWFLVTAVIARVRDLPVPRRLMLSGWTTVLAFVLLLPTPSKPSHHFGAIAGVGAPFLALILVAGPGLVRASVRTVRAREGKVPVPAVLASAVAAIAVIALAGHGRNRWGFMWGLGMPSWLDYPSVRGFFLDQPQWWAAILIVLALGVALVTSWRGRGWRPWSLMIAIPMLCTVAMAASTARMVSDFWLSADHTTSTYSPAADAWQDPQATRCGAEQAIDVLTPQRTALVSRDRIPPIGDEPLGQAFVRDAFFPTSRPPADLPRGLPVWGSFLPPEEGRSPDSRTGSFTTDWFRLPPGSTRDSALTTEVSGRLGEGNSLRLEYGRQVGNGPGVEPLGSSTVRETSDGTDWRTVDMTKSQPPPGDATLVRIVADDTTSDIGGWLAFTAPLAQRWAPMSTVLPRENTYTVAWENAFLFPCIHQPIQQNGVTQTMDGFLGYGESQGSALADFSAQPDNGGIVGNAAREASMTTLKTRLRDFPDTDDNVTLLLFQQPYPSGNYDLVPGSRTVSGLTP